jgi:pimeloyl-ACP methyl ester carboxylesterase
MFGAFHEASPGRMQSLGVLLCNPFGQEAIRTHRLFRVLAIRLAKAGIHVLRFDYFGTGDSAGDDDQADLQSWRTDIQTAHEELVRLSGSANATWVASRLGAVAAIQALGQSAPSAQRLVLWDPVVEASAYAQLLRKKHVEALETSYSVPDPTWRVKLASDPAAFSDEAIGFAIPPALRKQLSTLHAAQLSIPQTVQTTVIADPDDTAVAAWVSAQQASGIRLQSVALKHTLEWTSDDSLNAALVPADAVQQLMLAIDR